MEYLFEDKQLVKIYNEKEKLVKEFNRLRKKAEAIVEVQKGIQLKLNRIREQMMDIVEKRRVDVNVGEWEDITVLDVVKGKARFVTEDIIEAYKKMVTERRNEEKKLKEESKKLQDETAKTDSKNKTNVKKGGK